MVRQKPVETPKIAPASVTDVVPDDTLIVELVVVHGMGQQKAAQTLLEWSESLLRRIDWLARARPVLATDEAPTGRRMITPSLPLETRELRTTLDDRTPEDSAVIFDGVIIASPAHDEAHDEVNAVVDYALAGTHQRLKLKISEARWSEAFLDLSRADVFNWGAKFGIKALVRLGMYFRRVIWLAGSARRALTLVPACLAIGGLYVVLAVLALIFAIVLPILSLLLIIPALKTVLEPILNTVVSFVGDAAVWTNRPVRAAAMRQVVRTEVAAARERLDAEPHGAHTLLVVVAHSEGATISADMLFSNVTGETQVSVDAFVSVGAAVTLLGRSAWTDKLQPERIGDRAAAFPHNLVRAWAKNHPKTAWLNFWGIWDPIPSGPISTGETGRRARWKLAYDLPSVAFIGPEEHPVHNTASPFTDHQTYSSNMVQVIDPIARLLMGIDPTEDRNVLSASAPNPGVTTARNSLHVRSVKALGLQRLLILATAIAALVIPQSFHRLETAFTGFGRTIRPWILGALGVEKPTGLLKFVLDSPGFAVFFVLVGALLAALWLNGFLWRRYAGLIAWSREHELPTGVWRAGVIERVVTTATLAGVILWLGLEKVATAPAWVIAAVLAVVLVVAPLVDAIPRSVPAKRTDPPE